MPYGDNCSPRRAELRRAGVDVVVLERRESQGQWLLTCRGGSSHL